MENKTDYTGLCARLEALLKDVPYATANLANASALLWQELSEINWAGFYLLQGEKLILGPFQGKPACIEIPLGRGVCGTAAAGKQICVAHFVGCKLGLQRLGNGQLTQDIVKGLRSVFAV